MEEERKKEITAKELLNFIGWAGRGFHGITMLTEESAAGLEKLFDKVRPYFEMDEYKCNRCTVWFTVGRGSFEEYRQDLIEDWGIKDEPTEQDEKAFRDEWNYEFPEEMSWFKVDFLEDEFRGNINKAVYFNGKICICWGENIQKEGWDTDITEELETLCGFIDEPLSYKKDGTYNKWLEANLPLRYRYGTVLVKEYKAAVNDIPEERNFVEVDAALAKEFDELTIKDEKDIAEDNILYEQNLTAQRYIELSAMCYRKMFADRIKEGMSDEDMYRRFADGRDGGFLDIDRNSPEKFFEWYNVKDKWVFANPSHLWEAIQGSSRTNLFFRPKYTEGKGWKYEISGSMYCCPDEAMMFYLTLKKSGVPVYMNDARMFADILCNRTLIGIMPCIYSRMNFLYGSFPVKNVSDFIHMNKNNEKFLIKNATWLPASET